MNEEQLQKFRTAQHAVDNTRWNGDGNVSSAIVYAGTVLADAINNLALAISANRNADNVTEKTQD